MNKTFDRSDVTLDISLDLNEVCLTQPIAVQEEKLFSMDIFIAATIRLSDVAQLHL